VREKTNAVVGTWFFQMGCHLKATSDPYLLAVRPAKAVEGDKKLCAWSEWVGCHLPQLVHEDARVTRDGNGLVISDSLYGGNASINNFTRDKRPFIIGLRRGGAFDYVLHELARLIKRQGQWAAAWSAKLGLVIISAYPPGDTRRACISNAYRVALRPNPIPFADMDKDNLLVYVTTGKRLQEMSGEERGAGVKRNALVPPTPNSVDVPAGPLPTSWSQIQCSMLTMVVGRHNMGCCELELGCDTLYYMQTKKKVVVQVEGIKIYDN
tara:strand:- start:153 stop:953 length:801 start_codon:yes stop_codon:yes gene_type:complete